MQCKVIHAHLSNRLDISSVFKDFLMIQFKVLVNLKKKHFKIVVSGNVHWKWFFSKVTNDCTD